MEKNNSKLWIVVIVAFVSVAIIAAFIGFTAKDCVSGPVVAEPVEPEMNISDSQLSVAENSTGFSMETSDITLLVGEKYKLNVKSQDSSSLIWSSSAPEIASVASDGTVTALKIGEAIILVTNENGRTARCTVSVVEERLPEPEPEEAEEVDTNNGSDDGGSNNGGSNTSKGRLSINRGSAVLDNGQSITLSITCTDSSADLSGTRWTSSNSGAISVSPNGASCVVTAKGHSSGTTITATNSYGSVSAVISAYGPVQTTTDRSLVESGNYELLKEWKEFRTKTRTRTVSLSSGESSFSNMDLGDGWVCYRVETLVETDTETRYMLYFYKWNPWSEWEYSEWTTNQIFIGGFYPMPTIPPQPETVTEIEERIVIQYRQRP